MFKVIFIVVAVSAFYLVATSGLRDSSEDQSTETEVSQETNRRVYDFEEVLSGKFITYRNDHGNFSLGIPSEAEIYDAGENSQGDYKLLPLKPAGGIGISLVSQLAEQTELFDGLQIDITYYENTDQLNLDSLISRIRKSFESRDRVLIDETIEVNNYKGYLFEYSDRGSESTHYYFISPDGEYILTIYVYSIGPDEEGFDKVAGAIISSLSFY